jgi:hypothetical protein
LIIAMDESLTTSLEQIDAFWQAAAGCILAAPEYVCAWTERTLARHQYSALTRRERVCYRSIWRK